MLLTPHSKEANDGSGAGAAVQRIGVAQIIARSSAQNKHSAAILPACDPKKPASLLFSSKLTAYLTTCAFTIFAMDDTKAKNAAGNMTANNQL